ncbi:MAG: type II toxin-antitoxin system VapC family toxin [Stenotrophobium sp.]
MEAMVFDASAAIACAVPDESPPNAIRNAARMRPLIAPCIWPFEAYNVLWMMRRKARMTEADYAMALAMIGGFCVELDAPLLDRVRIDVMALATEHTLTVYDASYLELAQRRRLPLATLDNDLRKAAKKVKVKLI